jgi:hypothetical protein
MLDQTNRRFLYGFVIISALGACSYDAPSVGDVTASASSASSSGMGAMGGAGQSSSSSEGNGGAGLIPMGGMGGIGGFGVGGGTGGGTTTVSSSSSSGGASSNASVQACGNGDCVTSEAESICCKSKGVPTTSSCEKSGFCPIEDYALKCDDRADCMFGFFCCMDEFAHAECSSDCMTSIVCKTKLDCPVDLFCNVPAGSLMYCGPP